MPFLQSLSGNSTQTVNNAQTTPGSTLIMAFAAQLVSVGSINHLHVHDGTTWPAALSRLDVAGTGKLEIANRQNAPVVPAGAIYFDFIGPAAQFTMCWAFWEWQATAAAPLLGNDGGLTLTGPTLAIDGQPPIMPATPAGGLRIGAYATFTGAPLPWNTIDMGWTTTALTDVSPQVQMLAGSFQAVGIGSSPPFNVTTSGSGHEILAMAATWSGLSVSVGPTIPAGAQPSVVASLGGVIGAGLQPGVRASSL